MSTPMLRSNDGAQSWRPAGPHRRPQDNATAGPSSGSCGSHYLGPTTGYQTGSLSTQTGGPSLSHWSGSSTPRLPGPSTTHYTSSFGTQDGGPFSSQRSISSNAQLSDIFTQSANSFSPQNGTSLVGQHAGPSTGPHTNSYTSEYTSPYDSPYASPYINQHTGSSTTQYTGSPNIQYNPPAASHQPGTFTSHHTSHSTGQHDSLSTGQHNASNGQYTIFPNGHHPRPSSTQNGGHAPPQYPITFNPNRGGPSSTQSPTFDTHSGGSSSTQNTTFGTHNGDPSASHYTVPSASRNIGHPDTENRGFATDYTGSSTAQYIGVSKYQYEFAPGSRQAGALNTQHGLPSATQNTSPPASTFQYGYTSASQYTKPSASYERGAPAARSRFQVTVSDEEPSGSQAQGRENPPTQAGPSQPATTQSSQPAASQSSQPPSSEPGQSSSDTPMPDANPPRKKMFGDFDMPLWLQEPYFSQWVEYDIATYEAAMRARGFNPVAPPSPPRTPRTNPRGHINAFGGDETIIEPNGETLLILRMGDTPLHHPRGTDIFIEAYPGHHELLPVTAVLRISIYKLLNASTLWRERCSSGDPEVYSPIAIPREVEFPNVTYMIKERYWNLEPLMLALKVIHGYPVPNAIPLKILAETVQIFHTWKVYDVSPPAVKNWFQNLTDLPHEHEMGVFYALSVIYVFPSVDPFKQTLRKLSGIAMEHKGIWYYDHKPISGAQFFMDRSCQTPVDLSARTYLQKRWLLRGVCAIIYHLVADMNHLKIDEPEYQRFRADLPCRDRQCASNLVDSLWDGLKKAGLEIDPGNVDMELWQVRDEISKIEKKDLGPEFSAEFVRAHRDCDFAVALTKLILNSKVESSLHANQICLKASNAPYEALDPHKVWCRRE